MESQIGDASGGAAKLKGFGSSGMFFWADKVDLKSIDFQLESHITKAWGKEKDGGGTQMVKEEWEIDPSKLEIRYVIAQGAYVTVYRATYEGQDVAELGRTNCKAVDSGELSQVTPKQWEGLVPSNPPLCTHPGFLGNPDRRISLVLDADLSPSLSSARVACNLQRDGEGVAGKLVNGSRERRLNQLSLQSCWRP